MIRVTLDKLLPGMKLAQNLERSDGMLLAGKGATLNEALIASIRRASTAESVLIEGQTFASDEEAAAWRQEEIKRLVLRFSKVSGDPVMEKLKRLEAKRIVETR